MPRARLLTFSCAAPTSRPPLCCLAVRRCPAAPAGAGAGAGRRAGPSALLPGARVQGYGAYAMRQSVAALAAGRNGQTVLGAAAPRAPCGACRRAPACPGAAARCRMRACQTRGAPQLPRAPARRSARRSRSDGPRRRTGPGRSPSAWDGALQAGAGKRGGMAGLGVLRPRVWSDQSVQ